MIVCMLVNIFGAKYLDLLNKVCIYWTAASVLIIMITLLSMADTKRSGAFVFGHYDASASGWCVCSVTIGKVRALTSHLGLPAGLSLSDSSKQRTP